MRFMHNMLTTQNRPAQIHRSRRPREAASPRRGGLSRVISTLVIRTFGGR